jgi:hypothetical protein
MYRNTLMTVLEFLAGVGIAALTLISIGLGFLFGIPDLFHYMRIRTI